MITVTDGLEIFGIVLVVAGAWLCAIWLGLMVTGAVVVAVANVWEARRDDAPQP